MVNFLSLTQNLESFTFSFDKTLLLIFFKYTKQVHQLKRNKVRFLKYLGYMLIDILTKITIKP